MPTPVVVVLVVLAVLLGWKIFGLALGLVWTVLIGAGIGFLARHLLPGAQPMSWWATVGYGVAGAVIGKAIGHSVFHFGWLLTFATEVATAALLIAALGNKRLPRP